MKLLELKVSRRGFLGGLALGAFRSLQSPPGEGTIPPPIDGIPAPKSSIYGPKGICFDAQNNLLIVDSLHCRVRKVDSETTIITTIAGDGQYRFAGDNGLGTRASLKGPDCVQVDTSGNVYISDYLTDRIRRVDSRTGIITTIGGRDEEIWKDISQEGAPATRRSLDRPNHMVFDSQGTLYGLEASRLFRIGKNGAMTTVAGKRNVRAFSGDGGAASYATLKWPDGLAIDRNGNIFISDTDNFRIRRIDGRTGKISSIYSAQQPYTRWGIDRSSGTLYPGVYVRALALDTDDHLYFVANSSVNQMNLKTGTATKYVGDEGRSESASDGSLALNASFGQISGIALDRRGDLHVADWLGNKIWKVDHSTHTMTVVAGNGLPKHPPRTIL